MQTIAVLGGGIGSLSAVLEITSDRDWKQKYDITVYQMGWRLGGKGASGRNRSMHDRIEEHGIHLWMGFYENAFRVIRRVYEEAQQNNLMPDSPFTDVTKAFSPMRYTPMMEQYGEGGRCGTLIGRAATRNFPASTGPSSRRRIRRRRG